MRNTPLDLEYLLVQEITKWTQDFRFKSPIDRGMVPVPIEVVSGFVPSFYAGPEAGNQDKAPVIAVRATQGHYVRLSGKVSVSIMILTWDDDITRIGYKDCSNLTNHLCFHLLEKVVIGNSFVLTDDPVEFMEVVDFFKDLFPYFCAGVKCQFGLTSATSRPPYAPPYEEGILQGGTEGWPG